MAKAPVTAAMEVMAAAVTVATAAEAGTRSRSEALRSTAPCDGEREALRRAILAQVVLLGDKISFDFKELLTQAGHARAAGRAMWPLVRPHRPEVLIGPGFGGAPLLYAIALAALEEDGIDLPLWMVRDQRKTHYRKRWVEGPKLDAGARAVIVDDFLGKGSAVALVDEALAADARQVDLRAVAVLFDYWLPLGSRQLSVSRFPVVSLFRRHDLGLTRDCHDAKPPAMRGSAPPFVTEPLWWRFDLNGHSAHPFKSSPAIGEGAVFAADDRSRVWRFDAMTGEARWCRESLAQPHKGIVQRLLHVDRSVVFGCYDGTVTRLDSATGDILWRWRQDSHVHATPVVDLRRNRLFINTEQGNHGEPRGHLYALDWTTGRALWRRSHGFWPPGTPVHSEPANAVLATANDRSLVCVDADSGELRWQAETQGLVRGRPAVSGDRVLVATESGFLQSFDLHSGAPLLTRRYGPGLLHQFLHVDRDIVHVLDDKAHLIAFGVDDFKIRWMSRLRSAGAWGPLPFGRHLLVLSREGHLAVFDPARELKLWEGHVGGTYRQQPAVGEVDGIGLLACASHHAGLKVFRIHPSYLPSHT